VIEIKKLDFKYRNASQLLFQNLNLELTPGHIYGLLGKNGAGKTSLLHILTGLSFPKAGEHLVLGYIPKQRCPQFLAQVYFLAEELPSPTVTIKKYLADYAAFYPQFNAELFDHNLKAFEINDKTVIAKLSYGQKKKFFIAFALATQTKLLILDEPTNGLDIPSKAIFRQLLAANATEDKLIIVSTHQVYDVENLIDSVILLDEGKIICNTSIECIAEKLKFSIETQLSDSQEYYYSEQTLNGFATVSENKYNESSFINLELFFNAVLSSKLNMQKIFLEN
jgi:ABC-2 type transport system ATP-binding protein